MSSRTYQFRLQMLSNLAVLKWALVVVFVYYAVLDSRLPENFRFERRLICLEEHLSSRQTPSKAGHKVLMPRLQLAQDLRTRAEHSDGPQEAL
jgi:hypothetical protein